LPTIGATEVVAELLRIKDKQIRKVEALMVSQTCGRQ